MAKKKQKKAIRKKRPAQETVHSDDAMTPDKLIGYFTAAYVLDIAGMLDPAKKQKLDSLVFPGCPSWGETVEESFGINRTFVRSVYSLCTELQSPAEAVLFILRGLGCPDCETRLEEVLG